MRHLGATMVFALAAAAASGCGGRSGGGGPDAGPDAAPGFEPEPPAPPAAPASPVLTPCPTGWREAPASAEGDVATCDPWPRDGPETCGVGSAHFPGEPGCASLGPACGGGDFAVDLPSDRRVLHALASAGAGGDGSAASPFRTIGEALEAASPGDVVAVGRGRYVEAVTVPWGVALWGACAAETLLVAPASGPALATVTVLEAGVEVRSLSVSGPLPGLWVEGSRAEARLRGVAVDGATNVAVFVTSGGTLSAEALAVRDTRPLADGRFGRALLADGGASVAVERAVFERSRDVALSLYDAGTEASLADVAVVDTLRREADGGSGIGAQVAGGARLRMERSVVERARQLGILVSEGGVAELTDVVVRESLGQESDGTLGRGLHLQSPGSRVEARRLLVDRCRDAGLSAFSGARVALEDAVVRETRCALECRPAGPGELGLMGIGLYAAGGARVEARRALLLRSRDVGCGLREDGTSALLADLRIVETGSHEVELLGGHGLEAGPGVDLAVERASIERCRAVALHATGPGTSLRLVDVAALETLPEEASGFGGRGLQISGGAAATFERLLVEAATDIGILAGEEGTLVAGTDLVVRATTGTATGLLGRGLAMQDGGRLEARRVVVEENRDIGVVSSGAGSVVRLEQALVRGTRERGCAAAACAAAPSGTGLFAADAGHVELVGFAIRDSALCGLMLGHGVDDSGILHPVGGTADLHEGEVSGSPIGVSLQTEGFSVERLTDRVVYRDNGRDLDSTSVPLPEARVEY